VFKKNEREERGIKCTKKKKNQACAYRGGGWLVRNLEVLSKGSLKRRVDTPIQRLRLSPGVGGQKLDVYLVLEAQLIEFGVDAGAMPIKKQNRLCVRTAPLRNNFCKKKNVQKEKEKEN
jgi:hypothetical protein